MRWVLEGRRPGWWLLGALALASCERSVEQRAPRAPVLDDAGADADADADAKTDTTCGPETGWEFAGIAPFFLNWCTGCHSSRLEEPERAGAPLGVDFDRHNGVHDFAERIRVRLVDAERPMPPVGGPSDGELERVLSWLDCGAPPVSGFELPQAPPSEERSTDVDETRSCARSRSELPEALRPRCSGDTAACVRACRTVDVDAGEVPDDDAVDACREACTKADTTPAIFHEGMPVDCSGCEFWQMAGCADSRGCHLEVASLACCIDDCIAAQDPTCFASECSERIEAFAYCAYFRAPECVDPKMGPPAACYPDPKADL